MELRCKEALRKAVEIAIANNPQLRAARNEIEIADAERVDASKRLNPAFSTYFEDYRLFHSEMGPFFQTQEITVRLDQEIDRVIELNRTRPRRVTSPVWNSNASRSSG